jgi:hypothetical protein
MLLAVFIGPLPLDSQKTFCICRYYFMDVIRPRSSGAILNDCPGSVVRF